jgi:hypothetical protein
MINVNKVIDVSAFLITFLLKLFMFYFIIFSMFVRQKIKELVFRFTKHVNALLFILIFRPEVGFLSFFLKERICLSVPFTFEECLSFGLGLHKCLCLSRFITKRPFKDTCFKIVKSSSNLKH